MKTHLPKFAFATLSGLGLLTVLSTGASCRAEPHYETQCESCHAPADRSGIEEAHPASPLSCVDCHGGDGEATKKADAHVPAPDGVEYIRNLGADQLDEVPEDYVRFINPGDLRIADTGCGSMSPAAEGGGCHQDIVDTNRLSVMSTFTGHYNVPRFLAGMQDRAAEYGSRDITDPNYDAATAPPGAVESIQALRPPEGGPRDSMEVIMDNYLPKSCPTCHAYSYGLNDSPGNYRSSGCTSCHMVYDNDGLSQSDDPTIPKDETSHAIKHELTNAIPESQCEHCHYQGGRIGLMFQGIREGGFPNDPVGVGEPLGEPRHKHGGDYYWVDEDVSNDIDETPPDLHFAAGMTCVDCHVGTDVHGDGNLYSTAKYQVGVKCEDCHGSVREAITEGDDGFFHADAGHPLKQLHRNETGAIVLTGAMDGEEHYVKQVAQILETGSNPHMNEAMGVDENGWSHADSLECHACHSSWRETCYGCHVIMDDNPELPQYDHQTGTMTQGFVQGKRFDFSIDDYFLGVNADGKVSSVCPSQQMEVSYIDAEGNTVFESRVRTTPNGLLGFGWQPNHPHTTSRIPQNCDRCHINPEETNVDEVRATYGFGNGKYFVTDEDGIMHDMSKVLDDMGIPLVEFAHEGTGPVPMEMLDRALEVRVDPQPRP